MQSVGDAGSVIDDIDHRVIALLIPSSISRPFASNLLCFEMSKPWKKGKVYRQPYEPATPDANVRIVILGGQVAGTYALTESVDLIIADSLTHPFDRLPIDAHRSQTSSTETHASLSPCTVGQRRRQHRFLSCSLLSGELRKTPSQASSIAC